MAQRHKKKIKKKQRDDHVDGLLIYISRLMTAMGLPSYRIKIMDEPADEEAIAEIRCVEGRYVAEVYLCKDWMKRDPDEQRDTITHEVLHIWHRQLSDWLYSELQDLMHDHEFSRIERQFKSHAELMVDNIAMILADTHRLKEEWEEAQSGCLSSAVEISPGSGAVRSSGAEYVAACRAES
jgi:hypothetical protein